MLRTAETSKCGMVAEAMSPSRTAGRLLRNVLPKMLRELLWSRIMVPLQLTGWSKCIGSGDPAVLGGSGMGWRIPRPCGQTYTKGSTLYRY